MSTTAEETRVAILEDELLVELMVERPDSTRIVGDLYLGKVEAVLPGIQAAFVDIGTEKAGFLHVSDLNYGDDDGDEEGDGNGSGNGSGNGRGRGRRPARWSIPIPRRSSNSCRRASIQRPQLPSSPAVRTTT